MFRKLAAWYREIEDEQIAVLERPELAPHTPAGWRRWTNCKMAELSPIERKQMHEFLVAYRGAAGWKATGKFALGFTLAGAAMHLSFDKDSWVVSIVIANLVGFLLLMGCVMAWFSSTETMRRKRQMVLGSITAALVSAIITFSVLMLANGKPLTHLIERLPKLLVGAALAGAVAAMPILLIRAFRRRQHKLLPNSSSAMPSASAWRAS